VRTVAELEARVSELRMRIHSRPPDVVDLRRQLVCALSALTFARDPESKRAAVVRYRQKHYTGQHTSQAAYSNRVEPVQNPSTLRAPEATDGTCPRCTALIVSRDHDGPECYRCGWHGVAVARPLLLEGDVLPPTTVGRWN
jgi:hypothetical protein